MTTYILPLCPNTSDRCASPSCVRHGPGAFELVARLEGTPPEPPTRPEGAAIDAGDLAAHLHDPIA